MPFRQEPPALGNQYEDDHVEPTPLWREAKRTAAQHGMVAAAYERRHSRFSRVNQGTRSNSIHHPP